jgi:hypothetical protein
MCPICLWRMVVTTPMGFVQIWDAFSNYLRLYLPLIHQAYTVLYPELAEIIVVTKSEA